MATQNHQLNFILNLKSQGFNAGLKKVTSDISKLQKTVEKISDSAGVDDEPTPADNEAGKGGFLSRMIPLNFLKKVSGPIKQVATRLVALYGAQKVATFFLGKTVGQWGEFYVQMQDLRREAQLSQVDIRDFGAQVISASTSYGVALNKVANIARFVGQGTNIARTGVARLAADLANISDLGGITEQNAAAFGHFLSRQLEMTEEQAFKTSAAIIGISRATNVSADAITGILNTQEAQQAIALAAQTVGSKEAVNNIAALSAELIKAGATSDQAQEVIAKLSDRSTRLFRLYAGSEFTFEGLTRAMIGANAQVEQGGLQAAAVGKVWDDLGSRNIKFLNKALGNLEGTQSSFNNVMNMSRKGIQDWLEQDMSPLQRISRSFSKFWTDQVQAIDGLLGGAGRRFIEWISWVGVEGLNHFREFTKWLGGKFYQTWQIIGPGIKDIWDLMKSLGSWMSEKFGAVVTFVWDTFGEKIMAVARVLKDVFMKTLGFLLKQIEKVMSGIRAAKELVDQVRGVDEGARADKQVALINKFAEQQVKAGLSHVDANAMARQKILNDMRAGITVTPEERALVMGPVQNTPPKAESPTNSKDPTVQLLQKQVDETKKLREELMEERQKNELRNSTYRGTGAAGPGGRPVGSAAVSTART